MSEQLFLYGIPVPSARPYKAIRDLSGAVIHRRLQRLVNASGDQPIDPSEILSMPADDDPRKPSVNVLFNFGKFMREVARIGKPNLIAPAKELITNALNLGLYVQASTFVKMARYHPASQNQHTLLETDADNRSMGYLTEDERRVLYDLHNHFSERFQKLNPFDQQEIAGRFLAAANNEGLEFDAIIPNLTDGYRVLQSIAPELVTDGQIRHLENVVLTLDQRDFNIYPYRVEL